MENNEIVECSYIHCKHKSREISWDSALKIGRDCYHPDCFEIKNTITEIKNIYLKNINQDANIPQLLGVINNLIFKKDVDAKYLLFGLNYCISINFKIKSPFTLHKLKDNEVITSEWNKKIGRD